MLTPIIERHRATAQLFTEPLDEDNSLELIRIPAGNFMMGSPTTEADREDWEGPQHLVSLASFFIGRYPITQSQWELVAKLDKVEIDLNLNPSRFLGKAHPVEQVNWFEAQEFCQRLSVYTERHYRLPTEAEWEYACCGGTNTPFYFGETITPDLANYDARRTYGDGPEGSFRGQTTPVNYFEMSNTFGLHDMHGNVWEWCQDLWHGHYEEAPIDGSAWLTAKNADTRIIRGGSWYSVPWLCRSAARDYEYPDAGKEDTGFRVVLASQ